jgi:lipopolysaccharide/colanic/teichoic acid biosynthesis glycosyltransferase
MESLLTAPGNQAHNLFEVTVFTKRILRIDGYSHISDHSYLYETTLFTYVTVEKAIQSLKNSEVVDAILLHSQPVSSQIKTLLELAREKAVPFIWYTPKLEAAARKKAFLYRADEYHHGAITPVFLKRIEALKKLKAYKNTRGDKPYETFTEDAPRVHQWALKRAMDIVVSLSLLMLLSPFLVLIAIIIKLESKGPVFYISKRAGSGYRIFNFYKFRSMRTGAEKELKQLAHVNQYAETSDSIFFKIKNDPRVTRFGAFLRRTSLDEVPQLVNVLLGDMSLVGNRPLPLYEAAQLTNNKIAWRFLAPAGITGLWQITKRGKENMSAEERIALDMEYAMNWSFLLDLKILFSTFPALLQKENV